MFIHMIVQIVHIVILVILLQVAIDILCAMNNYQLPFGDSHV